MQSFYRLHRVTKMTVDITRRHALTVNMDITFPAIPCAVLSIDVLDISGTAENDASFAHHMHLHKMRLDARGKQIGRAEYHTPQSQQIMDTGSEQLVSVNIQEAMQVLNMSHHIKHLGFGPHYPGQLNPLDGTTRTVTKAPYNYKYFLKVVPTEYYNRLGGVTETHQYSVSEYVQPLPKGYPPSLDVHYDLSPIVCTINEKPPSLLHFAVRICAVVGGAFAVTRMLDRWVHWLVSLVTKAP
ncbi:hypothetical protein GPECTOR_12g596 [Gonium pectorale]|uniref:Endoplasmic reticulum vesicle transporter C-terminal domain-containing protein n=1 Tax=Gonium pectorale TaxID=33097 RepID=A0A150GPG7_GONPE|nr:hypothetical protein GPECTOR_12g596 [Gonium pectorale]|eukprot:KXZ51632.1 hypothetical protein GPECTOR_12g596 [Gonium pectorale]